MNVLISGASIAGPALALVLADRGFDVTVVERAPTLREGGYAVDVRGAALEVVERLGLRDSLRPLETDTESTAVVDRRGRRFGRTPRGFGIIDAGDIEILRGDLARVLYDRTRRTARYRFDDSIAELRQTEAAVEVRFASGSRASYDVVVGADGVHSKTRELAFGPESAFVRPLGSCMAIFTAPNHLGLDREQLLWNGAGRIASIKPGKGNHDLKVCVFFAADASSFQPRDTRAQRELVERAFASEGWELPRFVDAMWRADDFYCDVTCQVVMDRHVDGRVALVGDAGYCPSPLTGQGTSLALVGAFVLGTALARTGDPRAALAEYDASVRAFVTKNQAAARNVAKGFLPVTPFDVWMRALGMRLLPYLPAKWIMGMAMRDIRDASRAIALDGPPVPALARAHLAPATARA
ncbi:MAG TPA: FAD-dependent monooxygenase [Polyangiaceae bacterium]|nr:FAD-dependent monooxygenase [Polyangiaceae bacterium]